MGVHESGCINHLDTYKLRRLEWFKHIPAAMSQYISDQELAILEKFHIYIFHLDMICRVRVMI